MKSLHNTNIIRPDVDLSTIVDINIIEHFGKYSEALKNKYIKDDNTINTKGIFENSVYKLCEGFKDRLETLFGLEYFREVVYCILKDIEYIPRCPICHNLNYLRDWSKGFQEFCCRECVNRYQTSQEWRDTVVEKNLKTRKKNYKHPKLEKLGIKNYKKDPVDGNYILIYDYCKHHQSAAPLRLYFNTLNKLLENGRGTLCVECNRELYDSYLPTEDDIEHFQTESDLFFREFGATINDTELSIKFFPKERKIIDNYFVQKVRGNNKEQITSLKEKSYYFENQLTEIPVCQYPGCQCKPRYHRLKAYNMYCDSHLNAFHGQSECEREICSFIKDELNINVRENNRDILSGQEIDLYCPEHNIAIECNGTFYHTSLKHSKYYHINKRIAAEKLGIRLFTIWSDSWEVKKEVCKQHIARWLGKTICIDSPIKLSKNTYNEIRKYETASCLYPVNKNADFFTVEQNNTKSAFVEATVEDYISVRIYLIDNFIISAESYIEIINTLKNTYNKDVNIYFDLDTDIVPNLNNSYISFAGIYADSWMWFKSGKRYPKEAFKDTNMQKCYNSGTAVYSTDSSYSVETAFIESEYYRKDSLRELLSNISTILQEDADMGDNYKSDYLISFKGLDIFLDYKLDCPYKRAYVGIAKDKDDVLYAKRSNEPYTIEIANKWSIDEPQKRQYVFEKKLLFIEIYSCKDADDIENQLNMLYYAVKHKNPFVTLEDIENEYEYFRTLKYNEDLDKAKASKKNNIVKFFQFDEFYAKELELYAYNPTIRRKLIQNRIEYLFKPESDLTFSDMIYGFKKSGMHYTYSHFNPIWTNWFINKYEIKSVYDPCGGWGHHLLGMLSCDKIIYNDISQKVCNNINRMKKYLKIENLEIHNNNAMTYIIKSDVDAFFMCPPYYNVETYETDKFQSLDEYKIFLNSIFDIWKQSSAKIFGIVLREDFINLINDTYVESYALTYSTSHFEKHNKKRFNDYFYIFKKNIKNEI